MAKPALKVKPSCPLCDSHHVYCRKKADTMVCVTCGHIWPAEDFRQIVKREKRTGKF